MKFSKTQRIAAVAGIIALGIVVLVMIPSPLKVDTETIRKGKLTVTLDGEGMTRVRNSFLVTSPVNGRVERIELDEGDFVQKGALITSVTSPPLNTREREEAEARMGSAHALLEAAKADEQSAKADLAQAARKYHRYRNLYQKGAVSSETFEEVKTAWNLLEKQHEAALQNVESARYDLEAARAFIDHAAEERSVEVIAPENGSVLRIFEKNRRVVSAGTPLVELGDAKDIEVLIDVLSSDAVKIKPLMKVEIEEWGGDTALPGVVRTVEPAAFTKISALGIEEKRVNILVDLDEPERRLGDNYRVQAKIVLWQSDDVLQVPVSSIFRGEKGWNVFVVKGGKAVQTEITIGKRGTYYAEVLDGLAEGDTVVIHPTNDLDDGMRVKPMQGN